VLYDQKDELDGKVRIGGGYISLVISIDYRIQLNFALI